MARLLYDKGYKEVRPLLGGFEAWRAQGYLVERGQDAEPELAGLPGPEASS